MSQQFSNNPLSAIQQWMLSSLQYPGKNNSADTKKYLKSSPQLKAEHALAIYQRSYYSRLLTCLKEQYPALTYCLGEEVFNAFAQEYLYEHPSSSFTLYQLGAQFPQFLTDTRPDKNSPEVWIDFMVELAGFERLAFSMFDAPGDEGNIAQLNDGSIDDTYRFQKMLRLYKSQFPVAHYYCQVRDNNAPSLPDCIHTYVLMIRVQYKTKLVHVNEEEFKLLHHLRSQSAEVTIDNTGLYYLNRWLELGLLVKK